MANHIPDMKLELVPITAMEPGSVKGLHLLLQGWQERYRSG